MSLFALIPLIAAANMPEDHTDIKRNEIDLMYTFSKVSVKGDPYSDPTVNFNEGTYTEDNKVNVGYGWGNQATFIYNRVLNDSKYTFNSAFTFLHAGDTYHREFPINSNSNIDGFAKFAPSFYRKRNQINYYQADLFVKAELSRAKHAIFNVWGGLITSWFQVSNSTKSADDHSYTVEGDDNTYYRRDFYYQKNTYKNYYLGPNLKIDLKSPFFKNHFYVGLKVGVGLMMNFRTSLLYDKSREIYYDDRNPPTFDSLKDNLKNDFMLCPQADLEASLGYTVNHFRLEVGLNQFLFVTNLIANRFGTLTYGGPYIKAGYQF